jgi:hypothetical protein
MSPQIHAFLSRCLCESPSARATAKALSQDAFLLEPFNEELIRAGSARPGSRQTTSTVSFSPQISVSKVGALRGSASQASSLGRRFLGGDDSLEVSDSAIDVHHHSLASEEKSASSFSSFLFQGGKVEEQKWSKNDF